jgi:hypothetical protein
MIALITPTGGRISQLNICAGLMRNQTYTGEVVWIIIDDCIPKTCDIIPDDFRKGWIIIKLHPNPPWREGLNTQGRNLSVGINKIYENYPDIEAIFMIEDDDYYRPEYIVSMMERLRGFMVAGETNTIYYNVFFRRYVANGNYKHASLFQVAFTQDAIPIFRKCYMDRFIDSLFFQLLAGNGVNLFSANNLAIGIKGIGGRPGIGAGHRRQTNMRPDTDMAYLTSQIGTDAKIYERYYGGFSG